MIGNFFTTVFYQPLYNGLIYSFEVVPFASAGFAVILLTVAVKLIMFPLSIKATRAQMEMKEIESDINKIKEDYKDDKETQTKKTIELYKEKNINPFAGILVLLIQLPIIIALYQIFLKSGLPVIDTELLYSFVKAPTNVNMTFFFIADIAKKSAILAVLAGITTYFQIKLATPVDLEEKKNKTTTDNVMQAFQTQMKYLFPVVVFFISWSISSAVSLYWVTSNVFTIFQEIYLRKKVRKI